MRKKDRVIIGISVVAFLSIAAFVNFWEDFKTKMEIKQSIVENVEPTPSPIDIIEPETSHDLDTDKQVSSNDLDQKISKMWFDLRNGEDNVQTFNELGELLKEVMQEGELPQIVKSFPLLYVKGNEVGFQFERLTVGNSFVELLTVVAPNSLGKNKVKHILRKGTEVLDLGNIPFLLSEYGTSNGNLIVGGSNIDPDVEDFYTLMVIDLYDFTVVKPEAPVIKDVEFTSKGDYYTMKSSYDKYYLYEDFENEGVKIDELFLILDGEEQGLEYKVFTFEINDNTMKLKES